MYCIVLYCTVLYLGLESIATNMTFVCIKTKDVKNVSGLFLASTATVVVRLTNQLTRIRSLSACGAAGRHALEPY